MTINSEYFRGVRETDYLGEMFVVKCNMEFQEIQER